MQLILPFFDLLSQLPCQSHYQINPTICSLSSSSWAAKSYWENWITTLIDSATNLWFPMSAELSELLSSPITHSYLAGLPIPHSSCSHHTLLRSPTPTLTHLNPKTWSHLLCWEYWGHEARLPSASLLYVSKFISIFTHKDFILHLRRILILLFIWPFHSIPSWLCQDLVSSMGFLFSVQPLNFFQPTNLPEVAYFVKKKKKKNLFFLHCPPFLPANYCKNSWQRTLVSIGLFT